jgi:predicted dehydrogenase
MTTPSSQLNALIVVAGEEAAAYAETLTRVPDLDLVACCDRNGGAARALGERYEVDHYQSIEAALANKRIDIALVCTPPLAHADNVRALLQGSDQLAGILCATPPALSGADVERMCSEADRKGVALTFGFHLRHSPAVRWVRRLLDTRTLGDIKRISVESLRRSRTPSSGTRTMSGGGPGLHLLPPALDLALYLAEGLSPSEVTATTSRRVLEAGGLLGTRVPDDSDVEESIAGTLLLRDDDDCPVQLAFASDGEAHIPRDRLTVELHCTKGSATLELVQERNRAGEVVSEWLVPRVQLVVEGQSVVLDPTGAPGFATVADCHALALTDLVETARARKGIRTARVPLVTGLETQLVMRVVLAAYRSDEADGVQVDVNDAS